MEGARAIKILNEVTRAYHAHLVMHAVTAIAPPTLLYAALYQMQQSHHLHIPTCYEVGTLQTHEKKVRAKLELQHCIHFAWCNRCLVVRTVSRGGAASATAHLATKLCSVTAAVGSRAKAAFASARARSFSCRHMCRLSFHNGEFLTCVFRMQQLSFLQIHWLCTTGSILLLTNLPLPSAWTTFVGEYIVLHRCTCC